MSHFWPRGLLSPFRSIYIVFLIFNDIVAVVVFDGEFSLLCILSDPPFNFSIK